MITSLAYLRSCFGARVVVALTLCAVLCTGQLAAQQRRTLSMADAEQQFLARNLSMIAARYDVAIARAAVVTAGLWPNPELALEYNVYNPTTQQWFPLALTGTPLGSQQNVSLQQLVEVAGKRGKRVDVATLDQRTSEERVLDVARSLLNVVRSASLDLYHIDAKLSAYAEGIGALDRTVAALNTIQSKNVMPIQEIIRLRSLLLTFQQERAALIVQRHDAEAALRVLLRDTTEDTLVVRLRSAEPDTSVVAGLQPTDLTQRTDTSRPDVRIARTLVEREAANLTYQRSVAVPDVTLGLVYDKWGSAWQDYFGVTMSVPLPVFDRNQGNIEAAQARLEQTTAGVALARAAARNDVRSAVNKLRTATELYTATIPLAQTDLPRAMLLVLDAYKQGAIDITQFTDMYSAYKNSMIQMIDVRNAWYQAAVDLNTAVGTDVITLQ